MEWSHKIETVFTDTLGSEALVDDDTCRCGGRNTRTKDTVLVRKPQVLVLHLKRRAFDPVLLRPSKLHTPVSFETVFTLDAHASYDLRSVVVHGGSVGGGHYTAFVRAQDNFWYFCDDSHAPARCPTRDVLAAEAYMLIYERR